MKPKSRCSTNDSSGRIVRCTDDAPVLVIKFKPDAGTVSRREIDLIMSFLDDVLAEVEKRSAIHTAKLTPEETSPCMNNGELAGDDGIQSKRTTP